MFAYCGNDPIVFHDSNGKCREVGALLTWIDCKDPYCPTSSCNNPSRYTSDKGKAYSAYYYATKWHFEDRQKKNGTHPTYTDVNSRNSEWLLLPQSQSIYHDNGVGRPELKYITNDGREAVFDGDTLMPMSDPRFIATYNYSPLYQMPSSDAKISDYFKLASSGIGHFFADMVPYYLTGKSNTREQFESKVFIFN